MLDFDIAQSRLAVAGNAPAATEHLPLHKCHGRILAEALSASLDLPPADNSAMDGYAIRHADHAPGRRLPIQQRCYAGDTPEPLKPGMAIRLFTGSIMPDGADTIVMQEDTDEENDAVQIRLLPPRGSHVRHKGEDVRLGSQLFERGTYLGASEIALLASQGYAEIFVYPQLRVGILTTGDELVQLGEPRSSGKIYDCNGPMLAAMAKQLGACVVDVIHAADTTQAITEAFKTLLGRCDLVLTVGGVSVGDKDLVKPTLESMGGKLDLWRVCMKPGRPVALAHVGDKPVVCLPGNPVSAFVVFALLVSPLMRTMQGRASVLPPVHYGRLDTRQSFGGPREEFLRVQARHSNHGLPQLEPHTDQGSAIISSLPWADGLARIPPNTSLGHDDVVRYYDLTHWVGSA